MRPMVFTFNVPGVTLYPGGGTHWWENITSEQMVRIAREAESLGFDYMFVPTHIVMNHATSVEMGTRWSHSLSAASYLLGATSTIRACCLVVVPNHNPLELAKALSTADFMSGGRITPLLLVGYQQWEFDTLRQPFAERGAMMDEYVEAMVELWTADDPRYDGKYVSFDDFVYDPKPVQDPFPIWFGARKKVALNRVAKLGHGWFNSTVPRKDFREWVDHILTHPAYQADPRPLDLALAVFEGDFDENLHTVDKPPPGYALDKDLILEQLAITTSMGANIVETDTVLGTGRYHVDMPGAPPKTRSIEDYLERLHWYAEEIMPEARRMPIAGLS